MTQETGVELSWEVEGSWNCEAEDLFGNLFVVICGSSFEERMGVSTESRERVSGALEVSR